jgi:hypothetical protein
LATRISRPVEEGEIAVPASALDHAGCRAWVTSDEFPSGLRATYVNREVLLDIAPEALDTHNQVKLAVTVKVGQLVTAEDLGQAYVDGMLLTNRAVSLSTEPDLAFATWETLESGRLRPVPRPSVREYWLIDARGATISFEILVLTAEGYVRARSARGAQRSQVFGRRFSLLRKRNRIGGWAYELAETPRVVR